MWVITVYGSGVPLHPIQPLISGVSCVLGIMIVSKKLTLNFRADLKFILLGGICGSILNGLFNSLASKPKLFYIRSFIFHIWRCFWANSFNAFIFSNSKIYNFG